MSPGKTDDVLLRIAVALAAALGVLTALLAAGVDLPGDAPLLRQAAAVDALDRPAELVSRGTGYAAVGVLTAGVVALLVRIGRGRTAFGAAVAVAGAVGGNAALKLLVDRPRPATADPSVSDLSYPSGHAAATVALLLAVLMAAGIRRWLLASGALLVLASAGAQLVLGLHHPSDLVGGWLWAGSWTLAVWSWCARPVRPG